jgi:HEAT repeat protein
VGVRLNENSTPKDRPLSQRRLNTVMNLNIAAGMGGAMWFTVCSAQPIFNVFFTNRLGATSTQLGTLVAVCQVSAVLNLAAYFIINRVGRTKYLWIATHLLHRLFGLLLGGVAYSAARTGPQPEHIRLIFYAMSASWLLTNVSIAGWWSWIAELIPEQIRAGFFGRRSAIINAGNIGWYLTVTILLDVFAGSGIFYVYGGVFTLAGVLGILDILLHFLIPDAKRPPIRRSRAEFFAPVRNRNFVIFSAAVGLALFSINVFAPFAGPFITGEDAVGAPITWLGIMFVISQLTWIGVAGPWGLVMDRFGRKPVVVLGMGFTLSWLGYFILNHGNYTFVLPVIALVGGLFAPGFWEGVNQLMLTLTPEDNRIGYVSWYMTIIGLVSAGGAFVGGRIKDSMASGATLLPFSIGTEPIHFVLAISLVLVAMSAIVLSRIHEGREKAFGQVVGRIARPGIFRTFMNIGIIGGSVQSNKVARALREMDGSGDELAVEEIKERIVDPDQEVREEAARALGRIGSPESIHLLIGELEDSDSTIRRHAALALGEIGDSRAVPFLIQGLANPSEEIQHACARALGMIGDHASAGHLIELFKGDRSAAVKASGAEAASRIGMIEAAWEIIPLMHQTKNGILRNQLAIAAGNLLGSPGEFYQYITGSPRQREGRIDRLVTDAVRNTSVMLRRKPQERSRDQIAAAVRRAVKEFREERYDEALEALTAAAEDLVRRITDATAAEVDLLETAYRHEKRLGIWLWFLREIEVKKPEFTPEMFRTDLLLCFYFIAAYRSYPDGRKESRRRSAPTD